MPPIKYSATRPAPFHVYQLTLMCPQFDSLPQSVTWKPDVTSNEPVCCMLLTFQDSTSNHLHESHDQTVTYHRCINRLMQAQIVDHGRWCSLIIHGE